MAKFMNNTRWILTTLFIVLFGLSSCDDDDKSLEDMRDEIIANSNDVYADGLYGKVKTATTSQYSNARWESGKIIEGEITGIYTIGYDANGYETNEEIKTLFNGVIYLIGKGKIISRDSKNRETESQMIVFQTTTEGGVSYVDKWITAYDDSAKTAEVIRLSSDSESGVFEELSKAVYKLDKYGRLDANNSSLYYPEYSLLRSTSSFETMPSEQKVTEYDNAGNPVLSYLISNDVSGNAMIYHYAKTTYTYY